MRNIALILTVVALANIAFAENVTINPGDSIQDAINASTDGDIITIMPGTYLVNLNMMGKAITLQSSDPNDSETIAATILDGSGAIWDRVIICNNNEESDTIINGFTITGGNGLEGGGMWNFSSSPTITNCTFSGNDASFGSGGGMYNQSSSPAITNCTFSGNIGDMGGGMYNQSSSPAITNCTFSGNSANHGGGIHNSSSSPAITNCTFSGNSANNGAGMRNFSSSPVITDCAFSGNSANYKGGGMVNDDSSPTITDCAFSGNSANYGAGIYNAGSSLPRITGSTFRYNVAPEDVVIRSEENCRPRLTDNFFCGNDVLYEIYGGPVSYFKYNVELRTCPVEGDMTGDGKVDMQDLAVLAGNWLAGLE